MVYTLQNRFAELSQTKTLKNVIFSYKAKISLCDEGGSSPYIHVTCLNGHNSTLQVLLSNGTVINLVDGTRLSPFFVACYDRLDYSVGPLLLIRADINMCSKN